MAFFLNLTNRTNLVGLGRRLISLLMFVLTVATANGQLSYRDLHDFSDKPDGAYSTSNITFDNSGNAYGTTYSGGTYECGIVWEINSSGTFKVLHNFGGTVTNANGTSGMDGVGPYAGVSFDSQGNMFGTTNTGGGSEGEGMLWEITASNVYKDLHDFGGPLTYSDGSTGTDGLYPEQGVVIIYQGNLYGTTLAGGEYSQGIVWEVTSTGGYLDLHNFGGTITLSNGMSGPDGLQPDSGVTFDLTGNAYGTTTFGGLHGQGIVWEMNSEGKYDDLHDFGGSVINAKGTAGPDGTEPDAGVTLDSSGDLFGVAQFGGGSDDEGMVWEITVAGVYKDLHDFGGVIVNSNGVSGLDGEDPRGNVGFDAADNLYGTAWLGGGNSGGMIWEITTGGGYKDLHDFGGSITNANGTKGDDGIKPKGDIEVDAEGNMYGTTEFGGAFGAGVIWSLRYPERVTGLTFSPSTIGGLGTTTATISLSGPAPVGGWPVTIHAGASGYLNLPSSLTVQAGKAGATFTITGTAQRPATINMGIFVADSVGSVEGILSIQGDSIKSFDLSPAEIKWTSGTATATVTISSTAPPGGWKVTLTPGVAGYVNMPSSVTVPAGSTSATFSISGNALRFFTLDLGITTSDGGSKASATLVIAGDAVKALSLSPSTVGWGGTTTATVNLVVAAPPGGWLVNINPGAEGYVTMPSSITVPAGATSATFAITAGSQRSLNLSLGIYANDGPSNQSAVLKIDGDSVKSLTLSPSTISSLGKSTATVTLASAAPPGGWVLSLQPGASGYVSMPSTLVIPAGSSTGTFNITGTVQHSSTIKLGIFVSDGNSTQEAILTIT